MDFITKNLEKIIIIIIVIAIGMVIVGGIVEAYAKYSLTGRWECVIVGCKSIQILK